MTKVIDSSNLGYLISKMKAAFWPKTAVQQIAIDSAPTSGSTNLVTSGGIKTYVDGVIPTVPTISTNIQTDKASNTKTASPKAVYDEVHPATVTTQPSGGFEPNIMYNLGTLTGTVTFTMAAPILGIVNHYYWTFSTGSTAPTITWPAGITAWNGNVSAPIIAANSYYEISVCNGIGCYMVI